MIYDRSEVAIIRTSTTEDIKNIAKNMRPEDVTEIWRSHHRKPEDALQIGLDNSVICLTVEKDGKAIAMFGAAVEQMLEDHATVWLLATPELEKIQLAFIRHSKKMINLMLDYYPKLSNYVDASNRKTIRWLQWCGAEFGLAVPYGIEQEYFKPFQFKRG